MRTILVVAKDPAVAVALRESLNGGYLVEAAEGSVKAGLRAFERQLWDAMFLDVGVLLENVAAPREVGAYRQALKPFWTVRPTLEIVVMSPREQMPEAIKVIRAGAHAYISYPISPAEVRYTLDSLEASLRLKLELDYLRDRFWRTDAKDILQTNSHAMRAVYEKVRAAAPTKVAVLLTGETGTGKGVIARLIHQHSDRRDKPYIAIHCGAIPESLLESELFGHEKGAYTGASRKKLGKFQVAHGGTIFLDEVSTIGAAMQVKLLQALQERTIQMVGREQPIEVDTRIIAATNEDLNRRRREGTFRSDLYYRLNVLNIEVPPLRERREDIPILLDTFLTRLEKLYGKGISGVHPLVMEGFDGYAWPGNIREMENLVERAYVLEKTSQLTPESFPPELFGDPRTAGPRLEIDASRPLVEVRQRHVDEIEREYLRRLLAQTHGRINRAAVIADITERQFYRLMRKYGLRKEDFRSVGGVEE
ncbi:MAG: sigma-54-dependent Fis family transcriptional regulator [Myxococcales bacterium]|nr:MAG: sigma-54-dependent Fis family transcriptional regulator [Myxococcales bacterium]